jgi:hypothetical protein
VHRFSLEGRVGYLVRVGPRVATRRGLCLHPDLPESLILASRSYVAVGFASVTHIVDEDDSLFAVYAKLDSVVADSDSEKVFRTGQFSDRRGWGLFRSFSIEGLRMTL